MYEENYAGFEDDGQGRILFFCILHLPGCLAMALQGISGFDTTVEGNRPRVMGEGRGVCAR
jgi:hypothetical protein